MPFVTSITSQGSFSTTITQGEATFTLDQVSAPATFTASIAALGPKGDPGENGAAATIAVGTVTTVGPGDPATVTNSGTSSAAVFDFDIPQGPQGEQGIQGNPGAAATIAVGTVTTVDPTDPATVTNSGTSSAAVFNFEIPKGEKGDQGNQGIQGNQGNPGTAATIAAGTVTTLSSGSPATVTNSGTSSAAVFDFGIPKGDTGATGPQGPSGVVAATAPITYNAGTQTVAIDQTGFLLKADNLAGLGSAAMARTNLGLGTMAVETASNYALLNSPSFSGDPKAPTPATSDNDTSIATTAFVNAYCPAASTSTAGKVQLATDAQVNSATSTTLAITPYGARLTALNIQVKDFTNRIFSFSGSGGGGGLNLNNGRDLFDISAGNTTAAGAYVFLSQPIEGLYNTTTVSNRLDWSKPFEIRGRINPGPAAQTSSNAVWRMYLGGGTAATLGDPTFKSIGIKNIGGGQVQLMVHNGTNLFTVNTGYTQINFTWFDFVLTSDGAGNATLTINGSNVATSSNAPSTGTQGTNNCLYVITENIGIITGGNRLYGTGIRGYFAS